MKEPNKERLKELLRQREVSHSKLCMDLIKFIYEEQVIDFVYEMDYQDKFFDEREKEWSH